MDNCQEELSLEQQFFLVQEKKRVASMSREEAQKLIVEVYKAMLIKENFYKQKIKEKWRIGLGL
jgi:hypothetical protein